MTGASKPANRSTPGPRRSPPPPSGEPKTSLPSSLSSRGGGGQLGAFWSTQHAQNPTATEGKGKHNNVSPNKVVNAQSQTLKSNAQGKLSKPDNGSSKDFEINFFQGQDHSSEKRVSPNIASTTFQDQTFNAFVAEFDTSKFNSGHSHKFEREAALESEVEKLKEQLKEVNLEKAEITSKYEKLTAICRSQRQELQDLKQALAAKTPSPIKEALRAASAVATPTDMVILLCDFLLVLNDLKEGNFYSSGF